MEETKNCLNCGTALQDKYCSQCGQKDIDPNPALNELLGEFFAELFTLDSRLFRTLKTMVLSPGQVTKDYNAGRRTRYVPLMKLYLGISFLFFLLMALGDSPFLRYSNSGDGDKDGSSITVTTPQPEAEKKTGTNALEPNTIKPLKIETAPSASDEEKFVVNTINKSNKSSAEIKQSILKNLHYLMFFLMPVFALMTKILYRRFDSLYAHHLVFSVHLHTFSFSALALVSLVALSGIKLLTDIVSLLSLSIPVYLFLALRRLFGQSRAKTVFKVMLLCIFYNIFMVIGFLTLLAVALLF